LRPPPGDDEAPAVSLAPERGAASRCQPPSQQSSVVGQTGVGVGVPAAVADAVAVGMNVAVGWPCRLAAGNSVGGPASTSSADSQSIAAPAGDAIDGALAGHRDPRQAGELEGVRAAVERIVGRGDRAAAGDIGLTPRAKKVMELAVEEARRLGHDHIGTEHLLLGLVREGSGIGADVLREGGVDLAAVRSRVLAAIGAPDEPPAGAGT
jgi:hypothetical protein